MAVVKHKRSKYWQIVISQGSKKPQLWISSKTEDYKKAVRKEAELQAQYRGDQTREETFAQIDRIMGYDKAKDSVGKKSLLLEEAWDAYISLPDVTPSEGHAKKQCNDFKRFVAWLNENWPVIKTLKEVERKQAFEYMKQLRANSKTGKSYNNVRGNINTIFGTLIEEA
ncbi:MAG: hypothetical protein HRT89_07790, partial [Lentisphaeria bacterium]|nr:hypothetical protein [Lentisphaeria bacterium]NQZ67955.1 hypothetical protein [Lentisphaeria bacterium]